MTLTDSTTTAVATGAVATPWITGFEAFLSTHAILWLPVFGVIWLVVQISIKLYNFFRSFHAEKGNTSEDP